MRAKGKFISMLLVVDAFLVSYAVGFNSRHVLVVDPSLPPVATAAPSGGKATGAPSNEKEPTESPPRKHHSVDKTESGKKKSTKSESTSKKHSKSHSGNSKTRKSQKSRLSADE